MTYIYTSRQSTKTTLFLSFFLNLQSGANAVYYAARHGHVETLKFLHEKNCPLDIQDKVPNFFALSVYVIQTHTHTFKSTHIIDATAEHMWLYLGMEWCISQTS